jgi:Zn finger protein HypA/HybF involved in hydrogenase expression
MDVQARLAALRCPLCSHRKLDLILRCDVHLDGSVFVVRCESCRMRHYVDYSTIPAAGPSGVNVTLVLCPRCGSTECRVKGAPAFG